MPTNTSVPSNILVFKVSSVSDVAPGQQFSYSISVITSNTTDTSVTMVDTLNSNLTVLSASAGAGGSCSSGQRVSCSLIIRDVNPASVTIQVQVNPSTPGNTVISNVASVGSTNSSTVNVRVIGVAVPTSTPTQGGTPSTPTPIIMTTPTSTGTIVAQPSNTPATTTELPRPTSKPAPAPASDLQRKQPTVTPPPPPAPPTPEPAVPTEPPTAAPVVARPAVVRPTAVRRTQVPSTSTSVSTSAPATQTNTPVASGPPADLFFRLGSDWGSAYPGQDVNFTLVIRNIRAASASGANTLRNVTLRSQLPSNIEVRGAKADRGSDPTVAGNEVRYTIAQLAPGEAVELTVTSRIRPGVTSGTLLVAQGQAQYDGLSAPIFSNVTSVLVVGTSPAQQTVSPAAQQAAAPAASATAAPSPTRTAATALPSSSMGGGAAIAATTLTPTAMPTNVVSPSPVSAPLPATSGGVPVGGVLLMGMTMLLRTWRLHRARERI